MNDFKCPFCGSEVIKMKTPYVELNEKGEYVAKETWCCSAQAKNQQYKKNHFEHDRAPSDEEISKW